MRMVDRISRGAIASVNAPSSGWLVSTVSRDCHAVFVRLVTLLAPGCYDITNDWMLYARRSAMDGHDAQLIFYANTTPLIAPAGHPIIAEAPCRATSNVLSADDTNSDIQSLTGPGNLTACLVKHAVELDAAGASKEFELAGTDTRVGAGVEPWA